MEPNIVMNLPFLLSLPLRILPLNLPSVNNQLMLVMLSIVTRADTTVQNCIHRRAIKSTTVNSCNIVVLECSLRIVSESTIIDNHSSIIIVFYSVNATGKCYRFQLSRSD